MCSHGTRDATGRGIIARLRLDVAAARPGLDVLGAYVDVQKPSLDEVVSRLAVHARGCVVVPVLLSTGFHVRTDVARAVNSSGGLATATPPLGPDPILADVLADRVLATGPVSADDAVVLAAAGSSDPAARADVEQVADLLAQRLDAPVTVSYLSAARPGVAEAVASQRAAGRRRVCVATYLLAPGFFVDRLHGVGADRVSAPLAPDPRLADLVLRRYDAAAQAGVVTPAVTDVPQ